MIEGQIRITDGHNRTVDILPTQGQFQTVMYEAETDYHQNAWFATEEEAKNFAQGWVFKWREN